MPAEPERLTYVLTIDCDHLGERTANAAYILTLKVSYDCRPAPQHVMSWHLGQIGREAARVAGAPMTVAYGPADHAYEVAASAEGPVGRGGRSRPIASFGLFHAITVTRKGLKAHPTPNPEGSICSLRDSLEARRRMERAPAAVQGAALELAPAR